MPNPLPDGIADVVVVSEPLDPKVLRILVNRFFTDMVKLVVDLDREVIAVGGELHADAEAILLDLGSRQQNLWGANYYPGRGPDSCLEYTALINIRPSQGNRSMEVEDPFTRERLRTLVFRLIGQGEPLP